MAEDLNMDSFVRGTLSSLRRPRDVDFYSDQPSLISTSTKSFTTTSIIDSPVSGTTEGVVLSPPAQGGGDPWKVILTSESGNYTATVTEGNIYDGLLSLTQLPYDKGTLTGLPVVADDVICIKYTVLSEAVEIETLSASGFEAWEFDSSDPPQVTFTRYPLAKIIQAEVEAGEDPRLDVEQMSASNLARVTICINGFVAYSFTPL